MSQQKVGHAGVKLLGEAGDGVQVLQHGTVAVRQGKEAVVLFGADGAAVSQMVVPGNKDALLGKVLGKGLVAVDELHHAVGQLHHGADLPLRLTAEGVEGASRHGGGNGKVDHSAHGGWEPPL